MGGFEDDGAGGSSLLDLERTGGADTPSVAGLEAREAELGHGGERCVAESLGGREEGGVDEEQMVWTPRSSGPVSQQPVRKKPVMGSQPQMSRGWPRTFFPRALIGSVVGIGMAQIPLSAEVREIVEAEHTLDGVQHLKIAVITQYFPTSEQPWAGHSAYQTLRYLARWNEVKVSIRSAVPEKLLTPATARRNGLDAGYRPEGVDVEYIPYPALPAVSRPLNGWVARGRLLPHVRRYGPEIILNYVVYPTECGSASGARR